MSNEKTSLHDTETLVSNLKTCPTDSQQRRWEQQVGQLLLAVDNTCKEKDGKSLISMKDQESR